jgi:hypothetical protein
VTQIKNNKETNNLTLTLLAWTKWWASASASKWRMGFNSAFKGLTMEMDPAKNMKTKHQGIILPGFIFIDKL